MKLPTFFGPKGVSLMFITILVGPPPCSCSNALEYSQLVLAQFGLILQDRLEVFRGQDALQQVSGAVGGYPGASMTVKHGEPEQMRGEAKVVIMVPTTIGTDLPRAFITNVRQT